MKTIALGFGILVLILAISCIPAVVLKLILLGFGYDLSFWLCLAICWFIGFVGRVFGGSRSAS